MSAPEYTVTRRHSWRRTPDFEPFRTTVSGLSMTVTEQWTATAWGHTFTLTREMWDGVWVEDLGVVPRFGDGPDRVSGWWLAVRGPSLPEEGVLQRVAGPGVRGDRATQSDLVRQVATSVKTSWRATTPAPQQCGRCFQMPAANGRCECD